MKNKNKAVITAVCAFATVAASVFGTMAYFTSQDAAENTFTVGNVSITLDEAKVDDSGKEITGDGAERVKANTYDLIPGHTYDKDPTIHVDDNSEDCWLFVEIRNGLLAIEGKQTVNDDGSVTVTETIAMQMKTNGWEPVDTNNKTNIYYYTKIASGGENVPVFDTFTINTTGDLVDVITKDGVREDLAGKDLTDYAGKTISVTAYAVQADGFENAVSAWTAAKPQFNK